MGYQKPGRQICPAYTFRKFSIAWPTCLSTAALMASASFFSERGDKLLMLAVHCLYAHDAGHIAFAQGADKHMVIAVKLDSFRVAAAGHYQPVEFRVQVYVAGAERLTGGDKADLLIDGLQLVNKLIVYIGQGRFIDKALQRAEQAVYLPDKGLVNAQNGRALVGVDLQ